ncbi:dihydroorotate dehydrogenase electron transfer subunit [Neobacillus piezotolerans]|uniref:Dihydroorotate dehydrogenase B (NAD(+)), electron transfer subunit n=1 Tax=Neobacillus piezotolerans TaxID=2259171 RepID=A0A3D8GVL2_9BACI|nr:dihydroorotate dehydrogenase electron transfer subunit [Neobacillus piezotolerans]RDU38510.1 dihydroorotate dehydrogenase electron transfer subunit [Neobacillus piezotolerans]
MITKEMCKVVSQEQIAHSVFKLTLKGRLSSKAKPGQFVHVKTGGAGGPLLRRPISLASIDRDNGSFTMIFRVSGEGTALLSKCGPGMEVDVLGPLGNGFPVSEAVPGTTAILVGGGIGVPPLYELSRQLVENGVYVVHVLGFQTASAVFYEKEFALLGPTFIATADGSYGRKGFVTDIISGEQLEFDTLFACGPVPMLKALEKGFPDKKAYLSLEERMGCGIGACFACVCRVQDDQNGHSYRKVCSDGPVFRAGEVVI